MRAALALVVAACWTGADAPITAPVAKPSPPAPVDLRISLERTACFGRCATYNVTIYGDGSVHWHGIANVRELGERKATIPRARLDALAAAVDRSRFFELDERGQPSIEESCTRVGNTTSCNFTNVRVCSDTSHAIVVVRRNGRVHRIDDDHCESTPLARLEDMIDHVGGVERWR